MRLSLLAFTVSALVASTPVLAQSDSLNSLLTATQSSVPTAEPLSLVREAAMGANARQLGAQAGLADESRAIMNEIRAREADLDSRFRFADLMIGVGIMPMVISEVRDIVKLDDNAMRVAGVIYNIDEPAKFVSVPPTWRNYLYLGLSEAPPVLPQIRSGLPRDAAEQAWWKERVKSSYEAGRIQARTIFEVNLAKLERSYQGMRRSYDLLARGMITMPKIGQAHQTLGSDGPGTMVVGDSVYRITVPGQFVAKPDQWQPLAN